MLSFLSMVLASLDDLLSIEIIRGLSLYTLLFYNMFIVSFWVVFTRRS